jgi:hypothetical protein
MTGRPLRQNAVICVPPQLIDPIAAQNGGY